MLPRIESAVSVLREEEQALACRRADLMQEVTNLESSLQQVQEALTALGERPSAKPVKRAAPSKPAPNGELVKAALVALLQERGVVSVDVLRSEVEQRVAADGYSRVGLSLRIKESLADSRFSESPDGWRLVDQALSG